MNILAIGAHPDDIELRCGGALLAHRAMGDHVSLLVMTTGERGPQAARSRIQEQQDAARLLDARMYWGDFDDGIDTDARIAGAKEWSGRSRGRRGSGTLPRFPGADLQAEAFEVERFIWDLSRLEAAALS